MIRCLFRCRGHLILLLTLALSVCAMHSALARLRDGEILKSKDGHTEITLPDGWTAGTSKVSPSRTLAKSEDETEFALLISEAKENFTHTKLEEYVEQILKIEDAKGLMKDKTISEPKKIKINGHDAIQYEERGTLKNLKVVYRKTFIDSETHWNQVLCWSAVSNWDDAQPNFDKICQSFAEVPTDKDKK